MTKVDSRTGITFHTEVCEIANIAAGDEVKYFSGGDGVILLVKQSAGAAKGC